MAGVTHRWGWHGNRGAGSGWGTEMVSNQHQAGVFISLVIGLKLAGVSFEKETCSRSCSWAGPELALGFLCVCYLGRAVGKTGGGQTISALLRSLLGPARTIPAPHGAVCYRLTGLNSAEFLCMHAGGSHRLEL